MAKGKRLTVRLDDELDAVIEQACVDGNCDKATAVRDAIRKGFGLTPGLGPKEAREKIIPIGRLVGREDEKAAAKSVFTEVWNKNTGCCSRYRQVDERTYQLMWHFKPTEKVDGVQLYRDTVGRNPDNKWYKHNEGQWIPIVSLGQ